MSRIRSLIYDVDLSSLRISDESLREGLSSDFFADDHLAAFRASLDIQTDAVFRIEAEVTGPGPDSDWKFQDYVERDLNRHAMILVHGLTGERACLAETTQILSASMKVSEVRDHFKHTYEVRAFEDNPIHIEKYVTCCRETEDPAFIDRTLAECREASARRFDDLKKERE